MQKFLPFLQWLPTYKRTDLSKDLVAGLTVGVILIPQAMAYAMVAGLPPVYGLYSCIFPLMVYMLLGTSKNLGMGPVAIDSLLVAAGLGSLAISGVENYIAIAIFLAFLVGAIQLLLGISRMGYLVNFLSKPVINGFTSAAALIIIFSQVKHLLGVNSSNSGKFHQLMIHLVSKVSETNFFDLAIGIAGILILVVLKKWSKKIPAILLVVVLGILAVFLLKLESFGVKIVGEIPTGLPAFKIPEITLHNAIGIWPIALTLALVGYLEAISIGKSFEEKAGRETIDANQELVALGASNMVGSFFQSYPVTASFSRSAINGETNVRTNLAAIFAVILVVLTLLFLTPIFYYLPKAVLASVIMVSVFGLIDLSYAKSLFRHNRDEFFVLSLTFMITLFVGIPEGILVGVLISLLLMVYRTSRPHFAILGNIKGSDYYKNVDRFGDAVLVRADLLVVRFDSQLYFGNASYFKKQLQGAIAAKGDALKAVILNAEAINYIDSGAAHMLTSMIKEIHNRNIQFYIAGAIGPTRDIIFSSGIINELHREYLFVETKEAVAYFDDPHTVSIIGSKLAYQNRTNGN
ncbi:MAG: SulP family inorganic anion transporter [Flavobacteriaceae bacterium]